MWHYLDTMFYWTKLHSTIILWKALITITSSSTLWSLDKTADNSNSHFLLRKLYTFCRLSPTHFSKWTNGQLASNLRDMFCCACVGTVMLSLLWIHWGALIFVSARPRGRYLAHDREACHVCHGQNLVHDIVYRLTWLQTHNKLPTAHNYEMPSVPCFIGPNYT